MVAGAPCTAAPGSNRHVLLAGGQFITHGCGLPAHGQVATPELAPRVDIERVQGTVERGADEDESAGGHFRVEHQTEEGEAKRNDERFSHVAVWEYREGAAPVRHEEPLEFEYVQLAQRSYK